MHPAGARWKAMPLQQTEEVADTRRNQRGCDRKEKYFEKFCLQVGGEWLLENWGIKHCSSSLRKSFPKGGAVKYLDIVVSISVKYCCRTEVSAHEISPDSLSLMEILALLY